ncbi:MAG: CAP domain-containing protein [Dehalococcoidia bacterium]|nr:CAP domain-containing protein [Dehalococcoidia bacterium]
MRRICIAALLLLVAVIAFSACTREQVAEVTTYAGINAIRRQNGLPPLVADATLVRVARIRSADMASQQYFGHNPPGGCNYACLIDRIKGSHQYAGENIAWNTASWSTTAQMAVQMWGASPDHLENILNCRYQRFGTGVAQAADGRIYLTMVFEGNAPC